MFAAFIKRVSIHYRKSVWFSWISLRLEILEAPIKNVQTIWSGIGGKLRVVVLLVPFVVIHLWGPKWGPYLFHRTWSPNLSPLRSMKVLNIATITTTQRKYFSELNLEMGWDGKNRGRGGRGGGRRGGRGGGGGGWKERRPPPAPTNTDCPVQVWIA